MDGLHKIWDWAREAAGSGLAGRLSVRRGGHCGGPSAGGGEYRLDDGCGKDFIPLIGAGMIRAVARWWALERAFAPSRPPPPGGRATWTAFGLKLLV